MGTANANSPAIGSVTVDHPVLVRESAHEIIVNTKALELAHLDKSTPRSARFEDLERLDRRTNGRLSEMFGRILALMPKPSYEVREQSVKEVLQGFARNGVTTIYDFPSLMVCAFIKIYCQSASCRSGCGVNSS